MFFPRNVLTVLLKRYQTFPIDSRNRIAFQKYMSKWNKVALLGLCHSVDTPPHQDWFLSLHTNLNCLVLCHLCWFSFLWCFLSLTAEGVSAVRVPVMEKDHQNMSSDTTSAQSSSTKLFASFATRLSASSLLSCTSSSTCFPVLSCTSSSSRFPTYKTWFWRIDFFGFIMCPSVNSDVGSGVNLYTYR